jgi:DinB superfamily
VGHVLAFEVMCCKMYAPTAAPQGLPADMDKTYGKEGSTSDDPKRFLKKDELLKYLGQVNAGLAGWVRGMSPEDLAKPGPEQFKGWVNTIGELVLAIPVHETMHLGQIQVIRRKLGKKVLF